MREKSDWEQGYDQARRRFYGERKALTARIAKLEGKIDQLTAHDATERQDDKSSNNVATPIDVALRKRIAKLEDQLEDWTNNGWAEDYKARIAELEEAQRWIPVSERMPDDWESVLTIDISKSTQDVVSAFYNPETSLWSTPFSSDLWVTHWMPLPEPPIVYGKVCEE